MLKPHVRVGIAMLVILLTGCRDEIDRFLIDNYENSKIPVYSLPTNIEGKLQVTFLQFQRPPLNGEHAAYSNSIRIDNISSEPLNNLGLLVQVFRKDSIRIRENLLIDKYFSITETIPVNGRHEVFLDSLYNGVLRLEEFKVSIIRWNTDNVYASGLYTGQYRAFKDDNFDSGLTAIDISSYGEVNVEISAGAITSIEGLLSPTDSLVNGNALRSDGSVESRITGYIRDINSDSLTTTVYFDDQDLYDSIQFKLKARNHE